MAPGLNPASALSTRPNSHIELLHYYTASLLLSCSLIIQPLHNHRFLPKSHPHPEPQSSPPALHSDHSAGMNPYSPHCKPSVFIFLSLYQQNNLFHWPLSSQVKQRGDSTKGTLYLSLDCDKVFFALYSFTKAGFIIHFSLFVPNNLFFRIWRSQRWHNIWLKSHVLKDFLEITCKCMTKPHVCYSKLI